MAIATPFTEQGGVDEAGIARTVSWLRGDVKRLRIASVS